jgi:cation transport ATPase
LALGSACSVGAYSVATTLALFALLTETIEDWTTKRGTRLLWTRFGLPCAEQTDESTLRLGMFERSTAVWLEQFFVYLAIAAAAVTLLTTGETKSAIAVLIVGSASALTASMSLLALGSAAQALLYGFRMKDEKFMERLATVDVAILDEIIGRDDVSHEKTAHAIRRLRDMKVETVLFTGALQPVGDAIGQQIGVNLIEAELFPEDKPCKIAGLQRRHRKIVFLGDGTNAGSSLAVADVSILTGPESQTYQAEADASFLGEDLNSFAEVLRLARRTNRIAAVSFAIAVIVTSVTVGLAIQGKVSPQWALAVRFALDLTLILSAAQLLTPLWKRRSALPFRL